jgi:two-component system, chemotaxis family, chemotaxis protein CheY
MATKVLVVEDHAETREALAAWLEDKGYEVLVASDGFEGIIQAAGENPDLIIADLNMPNIGGVEMIKAIRERHKDPNIPILAITAYGMERAEMAIKVGADRALVKPIEPEILTAFVKELLARTNPLRDPSLS